MKLSHAIALIGMAIGYGLFIGLSFSFGLVNGIF